ncbi:MAG: hypothetical protein ACI9UQ_002077, partial [Candidatus Krumholzibacteriia bacterium]
KDGEAGVWPADNLALTYAVLGEYDTSKLLAEDRLQARPGILSISVMRLDPRWSGFVASPEFQVLAERYETVR